MKYLRTASTARLVTVACIVLIALIGAVAAVGAARDSGPTPPPKPLATALHDALGATAPTGITARITFTNNLFPSGAFTGQTGSALLSGATGRLWVNQNGGRLELQSDAGDVQIVWDDTKVTVYDASSNTAYVADLPKDTSSGSTASHTPPTLDQITSFLNAAAKYWTISGAQPSNVAGEQAYTVTVSPSTNGGLLGSAELAWDALRGVPLKLAVYAKGATSPALALEVTNISFGPVADSDVQVPPPAGAKVVDLTQNAQGRGSGTPPVTGLAAVEAAAPFTVVAPSSLAGQDLQDIRLVNGKTVIAIYGQGLGSTVLVERAQDTSGGSSPMSQLPTVSLNGVTANELATELGTVLNWNRSGVTFFLAGSEPSAAAEAAAQSLP